jgi:hypothetical protein
MALLPCERCIKKCPDDFPGKEISGNPSTETDEIKIVVFDSLVG